MTVLTGETGAGKTLIVDAISLLSAAGPTPPGATRGRPRRWSRGASSRPARRTELVLTRVIPASGRGRAYIDGRMASASQLAEVGGRLVDLHGQHAHQSLLHPAAQRRALDAAAGSPRPRAGPGPPPASGT